jgi:hypothetical protein
MPENTHVLPCDHLGLAAAPAGLLLAWLDVAPANTPAGAAAAGPLLRWSEIVELNLIVNRVRGEFMEMPGLHLTPAQASRLLGLDARTCECVLAALTRTAFLRRTQAGGFVRADA